MRIERIASLLAFIAIAFAPPIAMAQAPAKAKPAGAKGNYIKKVSVTSTMGPGLKLDIASLTA